MDQLRDALRFIRSSGYEFVALDEIPSRLRRQPGGSRILGITLDDGFADNLTHGLPVFQEFRAPITVFPVTGFLNRTLMHWTVLASALLRESDAILLENPQGRPVEFACRSRGEKVRALAAIAGQGNAEQLLAALVKACNMRRLDPAGIMDQAYLSWEQLRVLSRDALVTVGVHCVTHTALASLTEEQAAAEMSSARAEIGAKTGVLPRHIAYPFGSPGECGVREFRLARELGFSTGYTTLRGNLHARHQNLLWSLPRHTLSLVRHSASVRYVRLSLSGFWDSPINGSLIRR
ncbi:MAG: polysaccharide deacetylase family protein [Terriglobales bacterium]